MLVTGCNDPTIIIGNDIIELDSETESELRSQDTATDTSLGVSRNFSKPIPVRLSITGANETVVLAAFPLFHVTEWTIQTFYVYDFQLFVCIRNILSRAAE